MTKYFVFILLLTSITPILGQTINDEMESLKSKTCQNSENYFPVYLDRTYKWTIFIILGDDYLKECIEKSKILNSLCPRNWKTIHSDPVTFEICSSAYKVRVRPLTCVKQVVCEKQMN